MRRNPFAAHYDHVLNLRIVLDGISCSIRPSQQEDICVPDHDKTIYSGREL
jgi:hypothetical protein